MCMRYSSFLYELFDSDIQLMESIVDGYYTIFEAELTSEDQEYIDADPTPNKKYKVWILRMKKAGLKSEDLYKITEYLTVFDKYKQKLDVKDINQYKSVSDLFAAIKPIKDAIESGTDIRSDNQKRKAVGRASTDIDVILDSDGWKICHPKNKDAAILLGSDTEWCTATRSDNNMFDTYNKHGPMYVIISPDNKKWQFHAETTQFMDTDDDELDSIKQFPLDVLSVICKNYPMHLLYKMDHTDEQTGVLDDNMIVSEAPIADKLKHIIAIGGGDQIQKYIMDNIHELDSVDLSDVLNNNNFPNILIDSSLPLLVYLYNNHAKESHQHFVGDHSRMVDAMHIIMMRDQFDKFKFIMRAGAGNNPEVTTMVIDRSSTMLSLKDPKYEYYRKYVLFVLSNDYEMDVDSGEKLVFNLNMLMGNSDTNIKLSDSMSDVFMHNFPAVFKYAAYEDMYQLYTMTLNLREFLKRTKYSRNQIDSSLIPRIGKYIKAAIKTSSYLPSEKRDFIRSTLGELIRESEAISA